ncbi:glycosyltransferase [Exiguobacterium aurantiacum]|uniref:glycosyltransferase n=1 Tax=Exiguobacterium aurantiacum TaxID=33987 RepID=UPI00087776F3|nr:glycosyltransferase [Exiguobacterium aurantiacum]
MSHYDELLAEIVAEKKAWNRFVEQTFEPVKLPPWFDEPVERGISVIVASHDSEELLATCLASLEAQTLDASLIEWVLVFNGDKNETLLEASRQFGRDVTVHRLLEDEANVSIARNRGLETVTRQYVTFLDEDDTFSPTYLERLLNEALPDRVVIADIQDFDPEGNVLVSPLHREFERLAGGDWSYEQMAQLLTLNACKLIPAVYAKQVRYEPSLRSGEDVVYFSTLFSTYQPAVTLLPSGTDAVYFRQVRGNSVSRQAVSREFSIRQRLAVIKSLSDLLVNANDASRRFIERKIDAQTSMMSLYFKDHPEERGAIHQLVVESDLPYFSYSILNQHAATVGLVLGEKLENVERLVSEYPENTILRVYLLSPFTRGKLAEAVSPEVFRRLTFANMASVSNWSLLPEVCYSLGDVRAAALSTEYVLSTTVRAVASS